MEIVPVLSSEKQIKYVLPEPIVIVFKLINGYCSLCEQKDKGTVLRIVMIVKFYARYSLLRTSLKKTARPVAL